MNNSKANKLSCHHHLAKYNEYYFFLSEQNKKVFVARVLYFLKNIQISADEGILLNQNMKFLIASGFIQLTFGFNRYRLKNFDCINILKAPYNYEENGLLLHGLTDPKTAKIHLVWKVTEHGFKVADDAMNLAIHEFAHALILDNRERMTFRKFYRHRNLIHYLTAAKIEIKRIQNGKHSIFRKYGATNLMEFFAVSVEVFFEQSQRFALNNPLLYERMCLLLNQDPRKREDPTL